MLLSVLFAVHFYVSPLVNDHVSEDVNDGCESAVSLGGREVKVSVSEAPILKLQDVGFSYNEASEPALSSKSGWALKNIDLELQRGKWLAVAGANGSGKSTLARLIAGLHRPIAGSVQINGVETSSAEFHPAQLGIGYLSQHPEEHVVGLTVADDVAFGPLNLGLEAAEIERRVEHALDAVGLADLPRDASTQRLSGGEVQRLALAGILALQPSLLILDEPTVSCHPSLRQALRETIRHYIRRHQVAVLWVTHDPEEIMAADSVMVLAAGKSVFHGSPATLAKEQSQGRFTDLAPIGDGSSSLVIEAPTAQRRKSCEAMNGANQQAALKMQGVGFSYLASAKRVLSGVNLTVYPGEVVPLVGESGAGKSTLIQLAAMLEPRHEGKLTILGRRVPAINDRHRRGRERRGRERRAIVENLRPSVAVSFQQPEQQLFGVTVREDFEFGLRHLGIDPTLWQARIEKAIATVGLTQAFLDRSPFELSGGEKRRVAIAIGLAQQPDLFLLDEPTAGLDYPGAEALLQAIEELRHNHRAGVLLATHDPTVAARWRRRIACLTDRHIIDGASMPTDVQVAEPPQGEKSAVQGNEPGSLATSATPDLRGGSPAVAQNAWLSGVDPRMRLLGAAAVAAAITTVNGRAGLTAAAGIVAVWFTLAAYPIRAVLATARGLLPFLLAAIVFASLTFVGGHPQLSLEGFLEGTITAGRILLLVLSVSWLTHVGGIGEMLWALSTIFAPLRRIGLPVASLTGAAIIGIRMMPLLAEEARRIRKSQIARGVDRVKGLRGQWIRAASLVIPLSASLFRRAERLGEALHLRGFQDDNHLITGGAARGGHRNLLFLLLALAGTIAILIAN